jgi:upstream activation factor subunit UAF30
MGCSSGVRTEVTKAVWKYIKEKELQDPSDKREILCDASLESLFRRKKVNMFKMTKYLSEVSLQRHL